jgi:hypothetical protein
VNLLLFFFIAASLAAQSAPEALPTFHSMGLYWTPPTGAANIECFVRYRETSQKNFREAQSLWFDVKTGQYRGSVVHLKPATQYDFELRLANGPAATFTASTWDEALPVARTVVLPKGIQRTTFVISAGGKPGAYVLYKSSDTVFDMDDKSPYCIDIQASHVILRGIVCRGASKHGIHIANQSHIVIEGCDISQWGRPETKTSRHPAPPNIGAHMDSGIYSDGPDVENIIIQGNRIHHPRYRSTNWTEWSPYFNSTHPQGPKGVIFWPPTKGHHVVRYNDFFSDREHMFNDILFESLGGANSPGNGLVRDSDIYGNILTDCWDDAIEIERGDRNVRVWENYFSRVFKAVSAGWVWEGPSYIWRNVSDVKLEPHKQGAGFDTLPKRVGALLMPQQEPSKQRNSTVIFVYHNTILCPPGSCDSLAAGNGEMLYESEYTRLVSRNNIYQTERWAAPGHYAFYRMRLPYLSSDYELVNGAFDSPDTKGPHVINGEPRFRQGSYQLREDSPGFDAGVRLPNFNDGFQGKAPDIGAQEANSAPLTYGVRRWKPRQRNL